MTDKNLECLRLLTELDNYDRIDDPRWDEMAPAHVASPHDWRNHVPYELRLIWGDLSLESRLIAYFFAEGLAGAEEWE